MLCGSPHVCGELGGLRTMCRARIGSSPRMWGTRDLEIHLLQIEDFIPAHVGDSPSTVR